MSLDRLDDGVFIYFIYKLCLYVDDYNDKNKRRELSHPFQMLAKPTPHTGAYGPLR